MPRQLVDKLVIQAVGFGPELTAKHAIVRAQHFLDGLEVVSPWRGPFVVSGTTAKHSYMPIAENLSDFESVVMKALSDYDGVKYLSENDPDDWRISLNSKCYFGFRMSFSKLWQEKRSLDDSVNVTLKTQGLASIELGRFSLHHEVVTISVYSYRKHEVNGPWGSQDAVMKLIDYIIEFANPVHCCAYGSIQNLDVMRSDHDNYILGWITYTRNRNFISVLSADKRVTPHKAGVLMKLGEGVGTIEDCSVVAEILGIRAKLRAAGVTDWREL